MSLNLEYIKKRLEEFQASEKVPHVCEMCGFVTPCVCPQWDDLIVEDTKLDKAMDEEGI